MRPRRMAIGLLAMSMLPAAWPVADVPTAPLQAQEADVPRIGVAELKRLYDVGGVILLDVRGPQAYRDGHIPGAISTPLDTVARRAGEWKAATTPIVTYCS